MPDYLLSLLTHYGYAIIFPIALFEGHIITILVGFLWKMGYIQGLIGVWIVIAGNLTGDIIWYWIGYTQGGPFIRKYGPYVGIDDVKAKRAGEIFLRHGAKILFLSKVTNGFGMVIATLCMAGAYKIPFKKFLFYTFLGEVLWSFSLLFIGYFFGGLYSVIESYFTKVFLITVFALLIFILFSLGKRYILQREHIPYGEAES